jgi:DNA-binding transcriptional LysR family regulator
LEKLPQARMLAAGFAAFGEKGSSGDEPAGHVAFGYFTTLGPQYVPGILRRMAQRYPRVSVTPVEADLPELDSLLESGRIEIALSYDVRTGAQKRVERVGELAAHAIVPARHALARKKSVTAAELAAEPFILVDLPSSRDFLLSVFRVEGIEPVIAYRTRSLEMVYGMVANQLGVSVLVTHPAGDRAYDGKRVVRARLSGAGLRQGLILAWPEWSTPTGPAQALAECTRAQLAT